jgi:hypothetical protein
VSTGVHGLLFPLVVGSCHWRSWNILSANPVGTNLLTSTGQKALFADQIVPRLRFSKGSTVWLLIEIFVLWRRFPELCCWLWHHGLDVSIVRHSVKYKGVASVPIWILRRVNFAEISRYAFWIVHRTLHISSWRMSRERVLQILVLSFNTSPSIWNVWHTLRIRHGVYDVFVNILSSLRQIFFNHHIRVWLDVLHSREYL